MLFFRRNTITLVSACYSACEEANLWNSSPRCTSATLDRGVWELKIQTRRMKYDFFVDAFTGDVEEIHAMAEADAEEICDIIPMELNLVS